MELKKLAVWAVTDFFPAKEAAAFAKRIEAWGYGALWIPDSPGREIFTAAGWLLANTTKLTLATGIANLYSRDAHAAAAAQKALNEISGGRFLLGLGVSHAPIVNQRRHDYGKPLETMRSYLKAMKEAEYFAPPPPETPKTVIAALGPKMLNVARELADGAHPYNVTPEHTARARKILGPGKLLCVEQGALLETNPATARATARAFLSLSAGLPNYLNSWRHMGFTDADFANGGSDRLVDSIIVWGDEKAIRVRIDAHLQAGADQVCIQALGESMGKTDEKLLALLAPGG
jgi:probable F420-dependent oxidoreductase